MYAYVYMYVYVYVYVYAEREAVEQHEAKLDAISEAFGLSPAAAKSKRKLR